MGRAEALARLGQVLRAQADMEAALRLDPGNVAARLALARLYKGQGLLERAGEQLRAAVRADGAFASEALTLLGELVLRGGRPAEAERHLRRAVALRPQSVEGQALLGIILASQGKKEEAIPYLRRARELDSTNFDATFALGRLLSDGGQMEEGVALLREATKQAPESVNAHLALAGALRRAGKVKEAEQEAQTAESLKQQQQNEGNEAPR